jgi:FG-GAP-like repeat/FG-GAP repeat
MAIIVPVKGRILAAGVAAAVLVGAGAAWADLTPEAGSPYATGPGPYGVYAADFNGDGRPDLVTANGDTGPPGTMSVYLRQAGGGFAEEAGSPVSGGTSTGAVGDFNGDGLPDIAIADFTFGGVAVKIRNPGGGFSSETSSLGGGGTSDVAAGDFNGDGRPDLAIANVNSNNVSIALRRVANTGFDVFTNNTVGPGPRALAVADFDGDGDNDVAVANAATSNNVVLLRNNGPDGFGQENPAGTPAGSGPADIVAADFNGDGRPDVAVASATSNTVSVLLRNATNDGFADGLGSPIAVSAGPSGLATADFDRNGQPDLIVASTSGFATVLRRSGAGFAADAPIALTGLPTGATTADFNLDTVPDAAISSRGTNQLHVLLSPSPPAQPPPTPTATPTPPPALDAPKAGEVNVLPVKGTVKIKLKGAKSYIDLTQGLQVKAGASVDTRKGTVTIVGPGKNDKADFFDGIFEISQSKGLTTLTLTEALDCRTKARTAAKKPKSRKLWGDGKGKFRTKGKYSAATIRGTKWLVTDTCTSTTTRVTQGVVTVRDDVKKKNVIVRKGKRYTARAKKR